MNRVNSLLRLAIFLRLFSTLLWCALSTYSWGLPQDKNEAIRGSANNLVVDQKNGIATYTGAVEIQQGSLLIAAETIVIHTNPDSSVKKMVATGSPATFKQQPELAQGPITASAHSITYTPGEEHLLLVENASLEQDGSIMSGPTIDYDLIKEIMKASSENGNDKKRIQIVIPPKSDEKH
jgi:lipopolysaccharide export system protein LptA